MKNIYILLICMVICACGGSLPTDTTTVKGTLKGITDTVLYISYTDEKGYQNDKIEVKESKFEWTKPIGFPTNVSFSLSDSRMRQASDFASIWTEPGAMKLILDADNMSNYMLRGSKINDEVIAFEKKIETETGKLNELRQKMQDAATSEDEMLRFRKEFETIGKELSIKKLEYVKQNPGSQYSASLLWSSSHGMSPEEINSYLDIFTGDAANSQYVRRMKQDIQGELDGRIGSKASLFSGTDINGRSFDLSEFIGDKYVILDFWASWCVPCRAGNPHLKDLYAKYRDDGLIVVCVADNDSSPDSWRKAVAEDKLEEFIHVLRGWGGMENFFDRQDISIKYGVHSLPTKFLIDKNGTIIGRYGGGREKHEAMDVKLAELFGH